MMSRAEADLARLEERTLAVHQEASLSVQEASDNGDGKGGHLIVALERWATGWRRKCHADDRPVRQQIERRIKSTRAGSAHEHATVARFRPGAKREIVEGTDEARRVVWQPPGGG